ncbi:F-box only protein 16 [Brachionichthys hirsutus]|uniref:F-box only protein 16 n=1 Tax=Brachionichthys hirsutus TaxID=412623 RepID=UPI0036050E77
MRTTLSAWTPLNHPLSNRKVFEERRNLLAKWFDRWSDGQRKAVLQDFVLSCSSEQLLFLNLSVNGRLPLQAADFTCLLPRALCLYAFSFLDPRSLCRCARVSWHWKSVVELDQLWMPKCLRLGWCISFSPTPLEQGVWKRHYIQTVQELRLTSLQNAPSKQQFLVRHDRAGKNEDLSDVEEKPASSALTARSIPRRKESTAPPPWRDADRHPRDTQRFNYLDNLDPNGQARAQMNTTSICSKHKRSEKTLSEANYKLRKAKSLMFLSSTCSPQHPPPLPPPHRQDTSSRPYWATSSGDPRITKETAGSILHVAKWNAGIRPGPVRLPVPQLSEEALKASRRTHRSAPSKSSAAPPLLCCEYDVTAQQENVFWVN